MRLSCNGATTYLRCPREYELSHVRNIGKAENEDMRFGKVVHKSLEAFLLGKYNPDEQADIRARVAMAGYVLMWGAYDLRTLGTEIEFSFESFGHDISGRIDAIVEHNGMAFVMEHKTTSADISAGSPYWRKLDTDMQISTYIHAARKLGFPHIYSCIYDVIKKPRAMLKTTPKEHRKYTKAGVLYKGQSDHDETEEEYKQAVCNDIAKDIGKFYARKVIAKTDVDIVQTLLDYAGVIKLIETGEFPRNTASCWRYNSFCPYFELCK